MKDLKETVSLMVSPDYKDRFRAEYYQLKIRFDKLSNMVKRWDEGTLEFTPTCPREVYDEQLASMASYLSVLEFRADVEKVEL